MQTNQSINNSEPTEITRLVPAPETNTPVSDSISQYFFNDIFSRVPYAEIVISLALSFPAFMYREPTIEYADRHHFSNALKNWSVFASVFDNNVLYFYAAFLMLKDIQDTYYLQTKLKLDSDRTKLSSGISAFLKIILKLFIALTASSNLYFASKEAGVTNFEAFAYTLGDLLLNYYSLECLIKNLKPRCVSKQHQELQERITNAIEMISASPGNYPAFENMIGKTKLKYLVGKDFSVRNIPLENHLSLESVLRNIFILSGFLIAQMGAWGFIISMQKQMEAIIGEHYSSWAVTCLFQLFPTVLTWQFSSYAFAGIWDISKYIYLHQDLPSYFVFNHYKWLTFSGTLLACLLVYPTYPTSLLLFEDNYPESKINGLVQAGVYAYILPCLIMALVFLIKLYSAFSGNRKEETIARQKEKTIARLLESKERILPKIEEIPESEVETLLGSSAFEFTVQNKPSDKAEASDNRCSFFICDIEKNPDERYTEISHQEQRGSRCSVQ